MAAATANPEAAKALLATLLAAHAHQAMQKATEASKVTANGNGTPQKAGGEMPPKSGAASATQMPGKIEIHHKISVDKKGSEEKEEAAEDSPEAKLAKITEILTGGKKK